MVLILDTFDPNTLLISWNHWIPGCMRMKLKRNEGNIDSFGKYNRRKQTKQMK